MAPPPESPPGLLDREPRGLQPSIKASVWDEVEGVRLLCFLPKTTVGWDKGRLGSGQHHWGAWVSGSDIESLLPSTTPHPKPASFSLSCGELPSPTPHQHGGPNGSKLNILEAFSCPKDTGEKPLASSHVQESRGLRPDPSSTPFSITLPYLTPSHILVVQTPLPLMI